MRGYSPPSPATPTFYRRLNFIAPFYSAQILHRELGRLDSPVGGGDLYLPTSPGDTVLALLPTSGRPLQSAAKVSPARKRAVLITFLDMPLPACPAGITYLRRNVRPASFCLQ